jgi:tetratricopeptide (TPR) repeat protein
VRRAGVRAFVAVLGLVTAVLSAVPAAAQAGGSARVLVIPFENPKREASIFWLGEGAAVMLSDNLAARGVSVITREERRQAFERLHLPAAATLTDATVIRVAELAGATEVFMGSLQLEAGVLVVRARGISLDSGRVSHNVTDRGPMVEMFATFGRLAGQIAPAARETIEPGPTPPLAAFESFIKGLLAETPATAIKYLNASLAAAPRFDRARLALWDAYTEQGDPALALSAVVPVPAGSPWSNRARFLAGLSHLSRSRLDDAFSTFKALADAAPTPSALNNLGVVQLRRGGTSQNGQPSSFFDQAVKADPDDPDYTFNLGYAYAVERDPQAAIYWLRETVRRNPADGEAHFVLATELAAVGSGTEAQRERELARRLSSAFDSSDRRAGAEVPKGLERVKDGIDLPHVRRRIDAALVTSERRDQQELARFYLDRGRRQFEQEHDHQALEDLNRAIYLAPYEADAHLLIGRIHLRSGRPAEAIDAFKISIWSAETVQAHLALGEAYLQTRNTEAARVEAERAATLDPMSRDAKSLLEKIRAR